MRLFKPELLLYGESDGGYTLHSVTLTPSTCYSAGQAEPGAPDGEIVMPEMQPVTLHIHRTGRFCLDMPTLVRQQLPDLCVGTGRDKSCIVAFAQLHDADTRSTEVVGRSCIEVPEPGRTKVVDGDTRGLDRAEQWHAIAIAPSPARAALLVHGRVWAPHPGYRACLRQAASPDGDPHQLVLELTAEALPGHWPQVATQIDAVFRGDQCPDDLYGSVLIRAESGNGWVIGIDRVN